MANENEIVLFETMDKKITLPVEVKDETVWLSVSQMAQLFDREESNIRRHVLNVFKENEVDENNNVHFLHVNNVKKPVPFYSLDVIISVGYRVKSNRGVEFRRWANSVLKQYILQGYAVNQKRIQQLGDVIRIMKRAENDLDGRQILTVIERYNNALELLDSYDHRTLKRSKGNTTIYVITYEECMSVIHSMCFGNNSDLFGREKDDSFKGSIGNIYQSFDNKDVYESLEEKAANLLYFVTKNHSFYDGNKRIAATMFLYFLDKNMALFYDGRKRIEDATLVALTIMIAESQPEEKEMMISLVMNCMG